MLTAEMQQFIARHSAGMVATINDAGTPAVSPKATFVIIDQTTIAFGNIRSPHTLANIRQRPAVEVCFIDVVLRKAVRVTGVATIVKKTESDEQLLAAFEATFATYIPQMSAFVRIDISAAEMILSPAYDIGITAEELCRTNLAKLNALYAPQTAVDREMKGLYDEQIPHETDPATGLPIGPIAARPEPAKKPQRVVLEGHYCRLEPLDSTRHRQQLYAASTPPDAATRFRYLPNPAPASEDEFSTWMAAAEQSQDPLFFAVIDKRSGRVEGRQTLMRIDPANQNIEIGNIYWGPAISQSPVSTEANFLFARYIFDDLGYRRYEWKCDALNAPSRRAALRFGFRYEGHFRRAVIIRGRSRDTAWFSIIAEEWPALKAAYEQWLAPDNFDTNGMQKSRLSDLTKTLLQK